eukprot:scaffold9164_cov29-Tisochrysis_lutea.AAC.4
MCRYWEDNSAQYASRFSSEVWAEAIGNRNRRRVREGYGRFLSMRPYNFASKLGLVELNPSMLSLFLQQALPRRHWVPQRQHDHTCPPAGVLCASSQSPHIKVHVLGVVVQRREVSRALALQARTGHSGRRSRPARSGDADHPLKDARQNVVGHHLLVLRERRAIFRLTLLLVANLHRRGQELELK